MKLINTPPNELQVVNKLDEKKTLVRENENGEVEVTASLPQQYGSIKELLPPITWDGDTEGRPVMTDTYYNEDGSTDVYYAYKVQDIPSDLTLQQIEQHINDSDEENPAFIASWNDGSEVSDFYGAGNSDKLNDNLYWVCDAYIAIKQGESRDESGGYYSVPEQGIYLEYYPQEDGEEEDQYIVSFQDQQTEIKKIDERLIPQVTPQVTDDGLLLYREPVDADVGGLPNVKSNMTFEQLLNYLNDCWDNLKLAKGYMLNYLVDGNGDDIFSPTIDDLKRWYIVVDDDGPQQIQLTFCRPIDASGSTPIWTIAGYNVIFRQNGSIQILDNVLG